VADNQKDGIHLTGASSPFSLFSSSIRDHDAGNYGMRNDTGVTVSIPYNWWGTLSGPYHPSLNPDGAGNEVSDDAIFDPWLRKPMCAHTTDADLAISSTASPGMVMVGDSLTYTFSITNYGPSHAEVVTMHTAPPVSPTPSHAESNGGGCNESGGTLTCAMENVDINSTAAVTAVFTSTGAGTIAPTAYVSSNRADPDLTDNAATAEASVGPVANLAVAKAGSPDVVVGKPLTYTIVITNDGPSAAKGVTVTDKLPTSVTYHSITPSQGSCVARNPTGGSTIECNLDILDSTNVATVVIVVIPTAEGTIANTVSVGSADLDPDPADNTSTEIVTAEPGTRWVYLPLVLREARR
jgi:uncharacterized repeat protein (TIGR01451 family)